MSSVIASRTGAQTTLHRVGVITAPATAQVQRVERPVPAPDQVLIRLEGCGVCASSLPLWSGRPWFDYPVPPGAPGHEAWGYVAAVGAEVRGLKEGDRVATLSYHGHAEYDVASAEQTVRLPPSLNGQPMPGEPLGCAMNIFERSGIEAGQTVAIVGIGFLGALLTQLAVHAGARVIAISRRAHALAVARSLGAAETLSIDDSHAVLERVKVLTGGAWCERVIEAVGLQAPLDLAGELVGVRGRLVIAGYHQDGLRQVNLQQWNWRGIDVINAHERDPARYLAGIHAAIRAMEAGALDPAPLLTHRFPLERLDAALEMTLARPDGFMKAWVAP